MSTTVTFCPSAHRIPAIEAAIDGVYRDTLANAEFFAHLYDIQYPFEYNDFTPLDAERFALGERLFGELACLSCHVMGDFF